MAQTCLARQWRSREKARRSYHTPPSARFRLTRNRSLPLSTVFISLALPGGYNSVSPLSPRWSSAMRLHALLAPGVGLLFALTAPLTADDARDEAIKKDRKKHEGTWQV